MNTFIYLMMSLLSLGIVMPTAARTAIPAVNPTASAPGINMRWTADTLHLSFALSESRNGSGSNYAIWAMPRLGSATGDTITLQNSVFRGRRNMRYVERERHFAPTTSDRMMRRLNSSPRSTMQRARNEVMLGDTVHYDVAILRSQYPWLWQNRVTLDVLREQDGCC